MGQGGSFRSWNVNISIASCCVLQVRDAPTRVLDMGVDESPQLAEKQLFGN